MIVLPNDLHLWVYFFKQCPKTNFIDWAHHMTIDNLASWIILSCDALMLGSYLCNYLAYQIVHTFGRLNQIPSLYPHILELYNSLLT